MLRFEMAVNIILSDSRAVQESCVFGHWKERRPEEGFFVTTDLSPEELQDVLKSDKSDKWDQYLKQDNIKSMKIVSFADCQLDKVPMSLCNMTSITRLYFTMNTLKRLPKEFAHLENLTTLKLGWNGFASIPEALCRLQQLKVLSMPNNKLTNDGLDNIKQLGKLEQLFLTSNQLQGEFPLSICSVTSLMLLDIKHNRISTLPDDISKLTELRVLNARGNDIRSLPASMSKLKRLKEACFGENRIETVNLPSFLRLTDLKDLCLFANRLGINDDLENYISMFKTKGKLLRVTENRAEISQQITCDSPYEFCRHDVTFIHDGSCKVESWVKKARQYLENYSITSTVKSPYSNPVEIQRDMRSSYVNVPVFTDRFHEMVDKKDSTRNNLREALSEYGDSKNGDLDLSNFLIVFYGGECVISSKWFRANAMEVQKSSDPDADCKLELDELYDKITDIMGNRLSLTSEPI